MKGMCALAPMGISKHLGVLFKLMSTSPDKLIHEQQQMPFVAVHVSLLHEHGSAMYNHSVAGF